MARKSRKSGKQDDVADDVSPDDEASDATSNEIEDAEIVSETPPEATDEDATVAATGTDDAESASDAATPDETETDAEPDEAEHLSASDETDTVETTDTETAPHDDAATATTSDPDTPILGDSPDSGEPLNEPEADTTGAAGGQGASDNATTASEPLPPVPAPAPQQRSAASLFLPLLIGGLIAGAIGFGAARYYDSTRVVEGPTPQENAALIAEQQSTLSAAREEIDRLAAIDTEGMVNEALSPTTANIEQITERLDVITERLSVLTERVETIAMRPTATGIESDEFDGALAEFREQLNAAIANAQTEIGEAREEAQRISEEAFSEEQQAVVRGAVAQIDAALDSGAPYADALASIADITGEAAPDALAAPAEDGVPTLTDLQQQFPETARAALDVAVRAEENDAPMDRLGAFLRAQTGVRSLAPREGDDADAILSRAESAVQSGDVRRALSELEALPDPGRGAVADWESAARTRIDAIDAADSFAQQLNTN